jgi:hypothetical protein
MTRFVITSLILALSCLGASAAPIHVSVAPPVTAARSGVATSPGGAVSFIVVLTNLSDTAVTTWENANSWGYRTLAFEITTKDGKRHIATKKRQVFTRNGPSTFVIAPGVSRLIPVRLDSDWDGVPALQIDAGETFQIRAIYEVPPSPEAATAGVWVGRVASRSFTFPLSRGETSN